MIFMNDEQRRQYEALVAAEVRAGIRAAGTLNPYAATLGGSGGVVAQSAAAQQVNREKAALRLSALFQTMSPEELHLKIDRGQLSPEEQHAIREVAQTIGETTGSVIAKLSEAMRGMAAPIKVADESMKKLGEAMKATTTDDGTLHVPPEPEKPEATPFETMRMAWSLYRTGAATIEEITPLMDRAEDEASAVARVGLAAHGRADGLSRAQWCGNERTIQSARRMRLIKIPRALAVKGGEIVADGIPYRVVTTGIGRAMLQELRAEDDLAISGGDFTVEIVG